MAIRVMFESFGLGASWGRVMVGMVFDFLPFMILPIYTTMSNLDRSLMEASADLGAGPMTTFFKTVVPLSLPGAVSGILMVFMPSISFYAIAEYLGGGRTPMFGWLISLYIDDGNYNKGSMLSFILLALVALTVFGGKLLTRGKEDNAKGGMW